MFSKSQNSAMFWVFGFSVMVPFFAGSLTPHWLRI
jgi:hypothetical protein